MSIKLYPSDMSREKFEQILPILESAKKRTRPRRVDLYDVFNAVLYILKTGCQWRMLPTSYPNWKKVHKYFTIWKSVENKEGITVLDQVLKKNSWRGPKQQWSERKNQLYYN